MSHGDGEVEELSVSRSGINLKSTRMNTVFTFLGLLVGSVCLVVIYMHMTTEGRANDAFIAALRDQTVANTQALKEQTAILSSMAQSAREQNCLISMPQNARDPELCKRLSR